MKRRIDLFVMNDRMYTSPTFYPTKKAMIAIIIYYHSLSIIPHSLGQEILLHVYNS